MDEEELSEFRRTFAKYLDPKTQRFVASLGTEEFVHTISEVYGAHLRRSGVNDPTVGKIFLAVWEYLQQEVRDGIQINLDQRPDLLTNRPELLLFEVRAWKMGRDSFYEEQIDELNLRLGVDLRQAPGYETVKNMFNRKIESIQEQLDVTSSQPGSMQSESASKNEDVSDLSSLVNRLKKVMAKHDLSKKVVSAFIGRHRGTLDNLLAGKATETTVAQVQRLLEKYEDRKSAST